jgi:hypothetical protein
MGLDHVPSPSGAGPDRPVARLIMERETGFEPATPSLEGWRSTAELFPRRGVARRPGRPGRPPGCLVVPFTVAIGPHTRSTMVARGGFEPPKAFASRFTVCPLWPLGYLAMRTVDSSGTHSAGRRPALVSKAARGAPGLSRWSWRRESNPRPAAYKAAALPLSYASKRQNFILCTTPLRVNSILAGGRRRPPGPLLTLAPDLVQEGRPRGSHVERSHAPGQRDADQDVTGPGHQGPEAPPLAPQH